MSLTSKKHLGYLIKKHRLDQHLSQENLCKGICAVSYLSKIESGSVTASSTILTQLFNVLHLDYCTDEHFIAKGQELINEYFKAYFFNCHDECESIFKTLSTEEKTYLCSPLVLDYTLVKCYDTCWRNTAYCIDTISSLLEASHYLSPTQHYRLFYLKALILLYHTKDYKKALSTLQKAHSYFKNCTSLHALATLYFRLGKYPLAIDITEEAFTMAVNEGNIICALEICLLQAAIYNNTRNSHLVVKHYTRALNLSEGLGDIKYKQTIYTQLGEVYLVAQDYKLSRSYLLKALALAQLHHIHEPTLYYMLAFTYFETKNYEKSASYLELAITHLPHASSTFPQLSSLCDLLTMRLNDSTAPFNLAYISLLESTYNAIDSFIHFNFKQIHGSHLIHCYKLNRRYKDALYITEALYVTTHA